MYLSDEEKELVERHRKAETIKAWKPRLATNYSVPEKIEAFNKIHALAMGHLHRTKQEEYQDEDFRHYAKEAVMELLGDGVFDALRRFEEG